MTNLQGAAMLAFGQLIPWFLVLTAAGWHFSQSPLALCSKESVVGHHISR
jgi:hypothetical protein